MSTGQKAWEEERESEAFTAHIKRLESLGYGKIGMWWNLSAYGISPEDLPGKLPDVEAGLIAAWNALRPNG